MTAKTEYLIGVDGGGTGTRIVVENAQGITLARGLAGPSGLINGADFAWQSILSAIKSAFAGIQQAVPELKNMAIGMGLAGVHNKQWASQFIEKNPGFARIALETDAFTTLLGAHSGQPGAIVAIGTGSVGESLSRDGVRCEVGGWGFPCGDEAGGAWLGFYAVNHLQQVIDGRAVSSAFSDAVFQQCGGQRDAVFTWLAAATQGSYAQIAPLVVQHAAAHNNPVALQIMNHGAGEVVKIATALDQTLTLPVALCGGLAQSFVPYLPQTLLNRLVVPHGDSAAGALLLIKKAIESNS